MAGGVIADQSCNTRLLLPPQHFSQEDAVSWQHSSQKLLEQTTINIRNILLKLHFGTINVTPKLKLSIQIPGIMYTLILHHVHDNQSHDYIILFPLTCTNFALCSAILIPYLQFIFNEDDVRIFVYQFPPTYDRHTDDGSFRFTRRYQGDSKKRFLSNEGCDETLDGI